MRDKYIEERYPRWFTNGDTIIAFNTPREKDGFGILPQEVIDEHNATVDKLVEAVMLLFELDHEKASSWWYGEIKTTKGDK